MANFQKKYGYERHIINHNKRQDAPKQNKDAQTREISATIELSLLVYMFTVFGWSRYTSMSNMECVIGIFILFVLATIVNIIKENIK